MYLPFNLNENKCFSIEEMFSKDAQRFKPGSKVSSALTKLDPVPMFQDFGSSKESLAKSGLALIEAIPGFKYKCSGDANLIDLQVRKGSGILLTVDCCLQFVPVDETKIPKRISFKAYIFDGSNSQVSSKGSFSLEDVKSNDGFSDSPMTAQVPRESCKGVLGETCAVITKQCPDGQVKDSKYQSFDSFKLYKIILFISHNVLQFSVILFIKKKKEENSHFIQWQNK